MKAVILYVEDDEFFARMTIRYLTRAGFEVIHCLDGAAGWEVFQNGRFDACILDIVMPGKNGFLLAKEIRKTNDNIPIIFTSVRYLEQDRIHGYVIGGDDYLVKPFNLEEMIQRVGVFLRRSKTPESDQRLQYKIGALTFDYSEMRIVHLPSNTTIQLPPKEAALLRFLCEHANKKLEKKYVLNEVWGDDDFFVGRSMDVYLTRLRKHFSLDPGIRLETFHSRGLMLVTTDGDVSAS